MTIASGLGLFFYGMIVSVIVMFIILKVFDNE
jgi:hypothetical protein